MPVNNTAPDHEIVQVAAPSSPEREKLYRQCIELRIEVFTYEQGFDLECEVDELDLIATHFLLRLVPSLKPIGTVRMTKAEGDSYYRLSRLVVLKDFRKFSLGKALVKAGHQYAINEQRRVGAKGPIEVILYSQIYAKGFYERNGYTPEGDEFEEDGAPHQRMRACIEIN